MNFLEQYTKIIDFEYNKERSNDEIIERDCKVTFSAINDDETIKTTGFYFRWLVRLSSTNGVILHILCEDSYSIDDPSLITTEKLLFLMKKSLLDFRIKVYAKLNKVLVFDIPIDEPLAAKFLTELRTNFK